MLHGPPRVGPAADPTAATPRLNDQGRWPAPRSPRRTPRSARTTTGSWLAGHSVWLPAHSARVAGMQRVLFALAAVGFLAGSLSWLGGARRAYQRALAVERRGLQAAQWRSLAAKDGLAGALLLSLVPVMVAEAVQGRTLAADWFLLLPPAAGACRRLGAGQRPPVGRSLGGGAGHGVCGPLRPGGAALRQRRPPARPPGQPRHRAAAGADRSATWPVRAPRDQGAAGGVATRLPSGGVHRGLVEAYGRLGGLDEEGVVELVRQGEFACCTSGSTRAGPSPFVTISPRSSSAHPPRGNLSPPGGQLESMGKLLG